MNRGSPIQNPGSVARHVLARVLHDDRPGSSTRDPGVIDADHSRRARPQGGYRQHATSSRRPPVGISGNLQRRRSATSPLTGQTLSGTATANRDHCWVSRRARCRPRAVQRQQSRHSRSRPSTTSDIRSFTVTNSGSQRRRCHYAVTCTGDSHRLRADALNHDQFATFGTLVGDR